MENLRTADPELARLVSDEETRIETTLNLIAAENHTPRAVMEIMGSVLNTKTIEGYPGRRFHAGCAHVDDVERLAIQRARALCSVPNTPTSSPIAGHPPTWPSISAC